MILFNNVTNNMDIAKAVATANSIQTEVIGVLEMPGSKFHRRQFKCANITGKELAMIMRNRVGVIEVRQYWYWNSNVLGKYDPSRPDVVWLNSRARQVLGGYVGTLFHELVHYLDGVTKYRYFHHGDNNYERWKEDTAEYYVDAIAEALAVDGRYESPREKTTKIVTVRWWHKLNPLNWF